MLFTLGMDEGSYILTYYLSCWIFLLCPCYGLRLSQSWCASQTFTRLIWYLYDLWSSWILPGIWTCYAPGGYARFQPWSSCCPPVDCGHPTWVKSKIPEFLGYPSWSMLAVPPTWSGVNFPPPPLGTCPYYTLKSTLDVSLSGAWPTIPWWRGHSWICYKSNINNKLESKVKGLVGMEGLFCTPCDYCMWFYFKRFGKFSRMETYQFSKWISPFIL